MLQIITMKKRSSVMDDLVDNVDKNSYLRVVEELGCNGSAVCSVAGIQTLFFKFISKLRINFD